MPSILGIYYLGFLIASTTALPTAPIVKGPWNPTDTICSPGAASPILEGPWNSPAITTSPLTSSDLCSTTSSSSTYSVFPWNLCNASFSEKAISSSSIPSSSRSVTSLSTSSPFQSRRSTVFASSGSTICSAGGRSSSTGSQPRSTPLSGSSIADSHATSHLKLTSTRHPSSSATDFAGRSAVASASATQPLNSTRSRSASASLHAVSSAASSPVSAVLSNTTSSTSAPFVSLTNNSALAAASPSMNPCGLVAQYYSPTPGDWTSHNTDAWLETWIYDNALSIAANDNGFAGAFATWAIGNPDFSCRDDGSPTDCDFNPCNILVLNSKGVDIRPTYYVMESMTRLHAYFIGLREAFTVSSIAAALSKDGWAEIFYVDKDVKAALALREAFNAVAMVVGITCVLGGIGGLIVGTIGGIAASIYGGVAGAVLPTIGQHADDTFQKSSDLGLVLGQIVISSIKSFTTANDILMHGQNYQNTGDLRDYFRGGAFIDYPGIDKNAVTDQLNGFLIGQAINALYRQQKIFILGGGNCGDNQGIGQGPQEGSICRNGKAWYLYWWQEPDHFTLNMHQFGWVTAPPGADKLGHGDYAAVTIQDILNSSLDAYIVAGYNYDNVTAYQRAESAITQQWANPAAQGPAWEGIFTIPVCNISATLDPNLPWTGEYILQPYGHESRPVWCGPICDGDVQKMRAFIHAANMDNYESPRHWCDDDLDTDHDWWFPPPE